MMCFLGPEGFPAPMTEGAEEGEGPKAEAEVGVPGTLGEGARPLLLLLRPAAAAATADDDDEIPATLLTVASPDVAGATEAEAATEATLLAAEQLSSFLEP